MRVPVTRPPHAGGGGRKKCSGGRQVKLFLAFINKATECRCLSKSQPPTPVRPAPRSFDHPITHNGQQNHRRYSPRFNNRREFQKSTRNAEWKWRYLWRQLAVVSERLPLAGSVIAISIITLRYRVASLHNLNIDLCI